jgi:hypothetical protein
MLDFYLDLKFIHRGCHQLMVWPGRPMAAETTHTATLAIISLATAGGEDTIVDSSYSQK